MNRRINPYLAILIIAIAIHLFFSLGAVTNSLHGWHEFRQTQTAITVKYFIKDGWQLDYQTPIVGYPWKAPLEFPVYQTIVYVVHQLFKGNLEAEGRIVALIFFYLSLLVIYKFLVKLNVTSRNNIYLILAGILLSNYYLYWGSVFLIETTALFFSLWYSYLLYRNILLRQKVSPFSWLFVLLIGLTGMLAKVTAFIPITFPIIVAIGIYLIYKSNLSTAFRKMIIPSITFLVCVIVQYFWVAYTNQIKAENPFARVWLSHNVNGWTFGTIQQRLTPSAWLLFFTGLGHYQWTLYIFLSAITIYNSLVNKTARWFNAVVLSMFLLGPALFFNLFMIHTYYSIAINLFFIILIFYNVFELKNTIRLSFMTPRLKTIAVATLYMAMMALFAYRIIHVGLPDKFITSRPENNPYNGLSEYIAHNTTDSDFLIICNNNILNSNISYYIDRKTLNTELDTIDNIATRDLIFKRNQQEGFKGIIILQAEDTLKTSTAEIWGVSDRPAYKYWLDVGGGRPAVWLSYYK